MQIFKNNKKSDKDKLDIALTALEKLEIISKNQLMNIATLKKVTHCR